MRSHHAEPLRSGNRSMLRIAVMLLFLVVAAGLIANAAITAFFKPSQEIPRSSNRHAIYPVTDPTVPLAIQLFIGFKDAREAPEVLRKHGDSLVDFDSQRSIGTVLAQLGPGRDPVEEYRRDPQVASVSWISHGMRP